MNGIVVDTDRLAAGLETGIAQTRVITASTPADRMLRIAPCGLVSTAIFEHALQHDIPAQLLITEPQFPFDADMRHVVVALGEAGPEQRVVDASYSQFLGYVGLTTAYEDLLGEEVFPPEKILDFSLSERGLVLDWLTDIASAFPAQHRILFDKYRHAHGVGPLSVSPRTAIRNTFARIWDPGAMKPWLPPAHVREPSKIVGDHIPVGAITIAP